MQLFSSRSGLIGVHCGDGMVRAGILEKQGKGKKFIVLCEQEMSLRSLSAEGDAWLPKESAQILSEQLAARRVQRGYPCALLLEPDKVFSTVVTVPHLPDKLPQLVRTEAEKIFPEAFETLTVRSAILSVQGEEMRVGIAGARTDILQNAMSIAQQAGLRPMALSTTPLCLGSFLPANKDEETVLLAHVPIRKEAKGTLTVFHQGWILDEQMIPAGTSDEDMVLMARDIVQEYEAGATPIRHVFFAGNPVAEKALRDAFLVPAPTPSGGVGTPTPFDTVSLPAEAAQAGWEDLTAACLMPLKQQKANFVLERSKKESNIDTAKIALAGGLLIVMLGVFYWAYRTAFGGGGPVDNGPVAGAASSSAPTETCRTAAGQAASLQYSLIDPAQITRLRSLCASDPGTVLPLPLCTVFPTQFLDSAPCTLPSHAAEQLLRASIVTLPVDKRYDGVGPVNRAQAIKLLLQTCPTPPASMAATGQAGSFTDVGATDWFAPFVEQALSRDIIAMNTNRTFRPSDGVTRAEFVKMLSVACGVQPPADDLQQPYNDVSSSDWFAPYARLASALTLFPSDAGGGDTFFEAARPMTRSDAAIALFQYLFARQQNRLPAPSSTRSLPAASTQASSVASSAAAALSSSRSSAVAAVSSAAPAPSSAPPAAASAAQPEPAAAPSSPASRAVRSRVPLPRPSSESASDTTGDGASDASSASEA